MIFGLMARPEATVIRCSHTPRVTKGLEKGQQQRAAAAPNSQNTRFKDRPAFILELHLVALKRGLCYKPLMALRTKPPIHEELDYIPYFGLRDAPFQTTPSPAFAYENPSMIDGLTEMRNVVIGRTGLGMISGDVGLGKTTLARTVETDLSSREHRILMFPAIPGNSRQTEASIMRDIAAKLGLKKTQGNSADAYYNAVYEFADAADRSRHTVAVIIDDAQELKGTAIKTLLRLLSMQTINKQLIQVLLFGQNPEMLDALRSDRALHSRLSAHVELLPFAKSEVGAMIRHRLKMAGRTTQLFTEQAVAETADASRGIPRLICRIAHYACIIACRHNASLIDANHIREAASHLRHDGDAT
ncbi:MAG: ExeA family protein [Vulcanimicrobiaceae bacterium]